MRAQPPLPPNECPQVPQLPKWPSTDPKGGHPLPGNMQSGITNNKWIQLMGSIIVNFWVIDNGISLPSCSLCSNFFPLYATLLTDVKAELVSVMGRSATSCTSSPLCGLCQVGSYQHHFEKRHLALSKKGPGGNHSLSSLTNVMLQEVNSPITTWFTDGDSHMKLFFF